MKNILKSEFIGFKSLTTLLRVGIVGLLVKRLTSGPLGLLCLFLGDGTVLRIQAKVTEVEPWQEVGTLILEHMTKAEVGETIEASLSPSWLDIALVEKLVLSSEKFIAESGVCIYNRAGDEFVILPGAFPHSVEIKADFFAGNFDPEHELAEYERISEVGSIPI